MTYLIRYNILENGDNVLKGKIGEMVFERIAHGCFPDGVICRAADIQRLFQDFSRLYQYGERLSCSFRTIEEAIAEVQHAKPFFEEELAKVEEKVVNIERRMADFVQELGSMYTKSDGKDKCIICGKTPNDDVLKRISLMSGEYDICGRCYDSVYSTDRVVELDRILREHDVAEWLCRLLRTLGDDAKKSNRWKILCAMSELSEHEQVTEFYPFAEWCWLEFLKELYDNDRGETTFDFVGVDRKDGKKLLVEVKSKCRSKVTTLSKREQEYAEKAKANGFIVVVPSMQFTDNWDILIELRPV